jgi:hypothetical protein
VKYAVLIYSSDEGPADPADHEVYMELSGRETTVGGAQLQPVATATTVRVKDGEALTTDGPFVETKEAFGGFYLIDVSNLDDALEFAATIPAARNGGAVEVRPLVAGVDSAEPAESGAAGSAGGGSGAQR